MLAPPKPPVARWDGRSVMFCADHSPSYWESGKAATLIPRLASGSARRWRALIYIIHSHSGLPI